MRIYRMHPILAILVVMGLIKLDDNAQTTAREDGVNMQQQIESILQTKTPWEAAESYQALFKDAGTDRIRMLKFYPHHGIGLRAAWEEVLLTIPEEQALPVRADSHRLQRFVGFVEGRLRVAIPEWWEGTFLGAQAHRRDNTFFLLEERDFYTDTGLDYAGPRDVSLEKRDSDVVLKVGNQSVTIPGAVFERIAMEARRMGPRGYISAFLDSEKCYLAVHSDFCYPYSLLCIGRKSGKVLWETEVWGNGGLIGVAGGPGEHRVTITVDDGKVMVFGGGGECMYIEAFSTDDGKNLFRFSTFVIRF